MPILFRRGFRRGGWGGGGGGGGADWTRKVAETGKADALAVGEVCKALISLERRSIPLNQQNGDSQEVRAKIQQAIGHRFLFCSSHTVTACVLAARAVCSVSSPKVCCFFSVFV